MIETLAGRALAAVAAFAADFDDRADFGETRMLRRVADAARQFVVIDMGRLPAIVADQENAVMQAARMLIGHIGVGAFDPAGEIGADEQVEDSIDAIGRNSLAARLGDGFGDIISAGGSVEARKRVEYRSTHVGPLLAALDDAPSGGIVQRCALVKLMSMSGHHEKIGVPPAGRKRGDAYSAAMWLRR
jgi:hypothetical protein